jgi:ABC-type glycerol-3-phosphate transport system substrate-binding protein
MPFGLDPLVLYWNRDLFAEAGISQPPRTWSEVYTVAERVSEKDAAGSITKSGVALGEFDNVAHAKDVLSLLTLQAGGTIAARSGDRYVSTLAVSTAGEPAAVSALRLYTEFANPSKNVYSWNRSLPDSRDMFATGDLALYFGYASEAGALQQQNPNLDFAVAQLPQIGNDSFQPRAYARVYAFAVPLLARNPNGAWQVAYALTGQTYAYWLTEALGLTPVRRDLLTGGIDGISSLEQGTALISAAWPDPDPVASNGIFKRMIESVTAGTRRLQDAVQRADSELSDILP